MASGKCVICGEPVFPDSPSNVLVDRRGNRDCPEPYWIVKDSQDRAVANFFGLRGGQTPVVRARAMAKRNPRWKAKAIKPHGHMMK